MKVTNRTLVGLERILRDYLSSQQFFLPFFLFIFLVVSVSLLFIFSLYSLFFFFFISCAFLLSLPHFLRFPRSHFSAYPGCPGTPLAGQAGLKLTDVCLPLSPTYCQFRVHIRCVCVPAVLFGTICLYASCTTASLFKPHCLLASVYVPAARLHLCPTSTISELASIPSSSICKLVPMSQLYHMRSFLYVPSPPFMTLGLCLSLITCELFLCPRSPFLNLSLCPSSIIWRTHCAASLKVIIVKGGGFLWVPHWKISL